MTEIWVAPGVIDRAMVVAFSASGHSGGTLAVWKGRSRVDVYDPAGNWLATSRLGDEAEEGTWSRADALAHAEDALRGVAAPMTMPPPLGAVLVDVDELGSARLVRANPGGYAIWGAGEDVDTYGADGTHLSWARAPWTDVPTASQSLLDLLQYSTRLAA